MSTRSRRRQNTQKQKSPRRAKANSIIYTPEEILHRLRENQLARREELQRRSNHEFARSLEDKGALGKIVATYTEAAKNAGRATSAFLTSTTEDQRIHSPPTLSDNKANESSILEETGGAPSNDGDSGDGGDEFHFLVKGGDGAKDFKDVCQELRNHFLSPVSRNGVISQTLLALTPVQTRVLQAILKEDYERSSRVPSTGIHASVQRFLGVQRTKRRSFVKTQGVKVMLFIREMAPPFVITGHLLMPFVYGILGLLMLGAYVYEEDTLEWEHSAWIVAMALLACLLVVPAVVTFVEFLYWILFYETVHDKESVTACRASFALRGLHLSTMVCTVSAWAFAWISEDTLNAGDSRRSDLVRATAVGSSVMLSVACILCVIALSQFFTWCTRWAAYFAQLPVLVKDIEYLDYLEKGAETHKDAPGLGSREPIIPEEVSDVLEYTETSGPSSQRGVLLHTPRYDASSDDDEIHDHAVHLFLPADERFTKRTPAQTSYEEEDDDMF